MEKNSLKYFVRLAKFCKARGIEFVAITTPIPDVTYRDYQSCMTTHISILIS